MANAIQLDITKVKVNVHSRKGFTQEEIDKHVTACILLEQAINSFEFWTRMSNLHLTSTRGKSNKEIYEMIMAGAEVLEPEADGEIDVWVEAYEANNRVVGYTTPGVLTTWVNKKFFDKYNYAEVACNIFHEWLHKIGFDHTSAKEITSVPYALGYLVEDLILELKEGKIITPISAPKLICTRTWRTLWLQKKCYFV